MTAYQKYLEEADMAGYLVHDDNTALVIDRGNFFHIVVENNVDGDWLVGRFYKGRIGSSGEYSGNPDFEGSLEDCVKYVNNWEN